MKERAEFVRTKLEEISTLFKKVAQEMAPDIAKAALEIAARIERGGRIWIAGNGGSASDSLHIEAEFLGRFKKARKPLPALSLASNPATLTAIANDFSFSQVFAMQVDGLVREGDVFIAISTSGESENILEAAKRAREKGAFVLGLSGAGGKLASLCHLCLSVPSRTTARIQEVHIAIAHLIVELVEEVLE